VGVTAAVVLAGAGGAGAGSGAAAAAAAVAVVVVAVVVVVVVMVVVVAAVVLTAAAVVVVLVAAAVVVVVGLVGGRGVACISCEGRCQHHLQHQLQLQLQTIPALTVMIFRPCMPHQVLSAILADLPLPADGQTNVGAAAAAFPPQISDNYARAQAGAGGDRRFDWVCRDGAVTTGAKLLPPSALQAVLDPPAPASSAAAAAPYVAADADADAAADATAAAEVVVVEDVFAEARAVIAQYDYEDALRAMMRGDVACVSLRPTSQKKGEL
jgi:hypothetical protein